MSDTPRTVLITGATEGIGHEVAHRLAAYGATVILHARTQRDGEEAVDRLVKAGADPLRLHAVAADFCRLRGRIGAPVSEGAAAVVHLASPGVPVVNGGYYNRLSPAEPAPLVRERKALGRLWRLSARLTGLDGRLRESA